MKRATIMALTLAALAGAAQAGETGGLSGRPLFAPSTQMVARCFLRLGTKIPIVGVGGIDSAETAIAKFEAGARLVQVYTGLIYGGAGLPRDIAGGLLRALETRKLDSLSQLVGLRAQEMAAI